jgi:RimJ/RimL family protein N-acetyltransferase
VYSVRRAFLPDGTALMIRRISSEDAPALANGFAGLSEESRRLRFLAPKPTLSASELRYFTEVDGHDHEALAALDPAAGEGVGIARFVRDRDDPTKAEVAVTIADDWQHRGVATLLLGHLTDRARAEGIERYTALVSSENRPMRQLLERLGAPIRISGAGGSAAEYEIELARVGLGEQLMEALRSAAAGSLSPPPPLLRLLRALVPFRFVSRRVEQAPASEAAADLPPREPNAREGPGNA